MVLPIPRAAVLGALLVAGPVAASVLTGFTDSLVANVGLPTALAFTPDGRLLIATQTGALRVYKNGALLATPALSLGPGQICTNGERGLLGVAVDPDFATNRFVYLYYTWDVPSPGDCVNRVSRFTFGTGDTIDPATELVLLDNIPSISSFHNGGDVHFGKDGDLYISVGDSGCDYAGGGCGGDNDAARDLNVVSGKILRIAKDGSIPADNPFVGAGTARCNVTGQTTVGTKCQETFVWGLRNPFRIAFDPDAAGTRFFINDVGQDGWEEIDEAQAGSDYGWNCREGRHTNNTGGPCSPTPPGMVDPLFEYDHVSTIPGTTSLPHCSSVTGGAFPAAGLWAGYDGSYLFADFICHEIFRLTSSGGVWSASDFAKDLGAVTALTFGPLGGGQALYYATYATSGPDGQVRRIANAPPVPSIASPAAGDTFRVGQTITLSGSATDAEDGALPASSLSWTVLLNHNGAHTHPVFGPAAGNNLTFVAPPPEDLGATDGSFLEVHLSAADVTGLAGSVQRNVQPRKVSLTFDTSPPGLGLTVNGASVTAPHTLTSWESWMIDLYAPSQSDGAGTWVFQSWSDGGGQGHPIVTPASPATFTATFQPSVTMGPLDFHTLDPCRVLDTRGADAPALAAGSTRVFTAAGVCGIPLTAKAVAVNVTVVSPTSAGHLQVWPGGAPATASSTLNFSAGQTRANNALIGLGAAGDFSVRAALVSGTVHLIVDAVGWFE